MRVSELGLDVPPTTSNGGGTSVEVSSERPLIQEIVKNVYVREISKKYPFPHRFPSFVLLIEHSAFNGSLFVKEQGLLI